MEDAAEQKQKQFGFRILSLLNAKILLQKIITEAVLGTSHGCACWIGRHVKTTDEREDFRDTGLS